MNSTEINKPWISCKFGDAKLYFAGQLFYKNKLYTKNLAAELLKDLIQKDPTSTNQCLKLLKGQFGFIYEDPYIKIGFVDKIRSFPLFYSNLKISINPIEFITNQSFSDINGQGLLEFEMAGYTIGNKTLYNSIKQIRPGEYIFIDKLKKTYSNTIYSEFFDTTIRVISRSQLLIEFDAVINTSIKKTIEIANGRKIIIPLSAGFDSRLILGKLLEQNYTNILCYTYGPRNIWEAKIAKKVANKAKVKWEFVTLSQEEKKLFDTKERVDYYANYSGFSSVPHLADFYCIRKLITQKKIDPDNSLIVNGQSGDFITGGHISKTIKIETTDILLNKYIYKHFGLWSNLQTEKNINKIREEILNLYPSLNIGDDRTILAKEYERIECQERQFKYVVNGQRAYDYYNIDWHLPLWSDEMLDFWNKFSIEDKIGQNSYIEYCNKYNPNGLFDIPTKDNTNSLPLLQFMILTFIKILSKVFPIKKDLIKRKYFNYFDKYSPYYPMHSYSEYLKDSAFHRHCVSYWAKYYLTEIGVKK